MVKLKVLLVGMQGVGIEVAKNLILAGPGLVTIYDDGATTAKDCGVNFFLTNDDIGKSRSSAVVSKLAELNKMVSVVQHTGELTQELIASHNVVVFTNTCRDEMVKWNTFCRNQSPAIGFISCDVRGAMGYTFTDFGDAFTCHDANGENPITRIITDISNDETGMVTLLGPNEDGKMHELPDSDHDGWIEISEVRGMAMNDTKEATICTQGPYRVAFAQKTITRVKNDKAEKVQVFDPHRLVIGDTSMFTKYEGGGMMTQHKKPFAISHRSLDECCRHPVAPGEYGLMFTDGAKFGRAEVLHVALQGVYEFEAVHGHLPRVRNEEDAALVLQYAKAGPRPVDGDEKAPFVLEEMSEEDLEVIRKVSYFAAIELHPLSAFFGGVVAQEIVKFTGKFTPMKQWLHLDAFEVLPDETPVDTQPLDCRYDHMIMMFGASFHTKLQNTKTFLVGCGALGCEYLKNFAMIGLACGPEGKVIVTDNDRIEVSNLNRQFLFRDRNVGQAKSVAATQAVQLMNTDLKVEALEHLVAPATEHIFDDAFWNSLDVITNALDNVKARLYVDSKCVYYKQPLLESGTLGTKCNVQVVVPHMTQSYADGPKDAENDGIPMCTLRNFPSLIEHCIEWARAQFEDVFVVPFADAKKFTEDPSAFLLEIRKMTVDNVNVQLGASAMGQELERLKSLRDIMAASSTVTFEKCVHKALQVFYANFRDRILQLIHNFPENHVTSVGEQFWSGAKRFPEAILFNPEDTIHMAYVMGAANVFAVNFGLHPVPETELIGAESECRNIDYIAKCAETFIVPEWKPSSETIAENDDALKKLEEEKRKAAEEGGDDNERKEFLALLETLSGYKTTKSGKCFEPADFEKDQDLNFHIDFIYSASNLRASNYRMKNASRHKCKMIAGKIIPAIATTTASVTGLAMLEMIKIIQGKKLEAFKDSSNSLGLNMYLMQEPAPPEKAKDEYDVIEMAEVKCRPTGFTKWDSTHIRTTQGKEATLADFLTAFKKETGLNCDLLFHRVAELGDSDPKFKPVSGLMLYDRNAFSPELKKCYESQMHTSLSVWIEERYTGFVDGSSRYIELQTSCTDDDDETFKVPTVIFHVE